MKTAIHDVNVWLPRTNTWLYNEVIALGGDWQASVVTNRLENRDEFPFEYVYSLRDNVSRPRWAIESFLRRTGLTTHAPSITRHCRALGAQLLHSHFASIGWRNLRLARRLAIPHVVTFYGFDVTQLPRQQAWRRRYAQMFAEVTRVLCEGEHMAAEVARLGCDPAKISVHRLGVRLDDLPFAERTGTAGPVRFLMAGSFREKKGLTDGMLALAELAGRRPDVDWQLTIVGGPGVSPLGESIARELRNIAQRHDVADRVTYPGFLSHAELTATAADHDVFLCPSVTAPDGDTEGGAPVVMIEMAAMGMPVAATAHCDMPGVLAPRNREMLVDEHDVAALGNALEWLVDHRDAWAAIGRENRAHCEAQFDHRVQGRRLAQVYDAVAG